VPGRERDAGKIFWRNEQKYKYHAQRTARRERYAEPAVRKRRRVEIERKGTPEEKHSDN